MVIVWIQSVYFVSEDSVWMWFQCVYLFRQWVQNVVFLVEVGLIFVSVLLSGILCVIVIVIMLMMQIVLFVSVGRVNGVDRFSVVNMVSMMVSSVELRSMGINSDCWILILIVFIVVIFVFGLICLSVCMMKVENVKQSFVIRLQFSVMSYSIVVVRILGIVCFLLIVVIWWFVVYLCVVGLL